MNQSSSASVQSSPMKKSQDTDWSPTAQDHMWPPFFNPDSVSRESNQYSASVHANDGFGRNLVSPVMSQTDQMSAAGTGLTFWSQNQTYSQIPAQNGRQSGPWSSNGSSYSLFGPNQFSGLLPEYRNRSTLNPNATPWNRTTGYPVQRQAQPDYLTSDSGTAAHQYTSSNNGYNNRTDAAQYAGLDQQQLRDHIAALEIQFRDFKLKPKLLTDLKHQLNIQQHIQSQDLASRRLRARIRRPAPVHCVFCVSNGEEENVCKSHALKDTKGRVTCPVLRLYVCPICQNEGGDNAHTVKYCPKNKLSFKHMIQRVTGDQQQQSQHPDDQQIRSQFQSSNVYTRK